MDLNADLGELSGDAGRASDRALLSLVTTTHVACGGHAGDVDTMRRTVATAAELGVVVGAHPSFPDREGFGRRVLDLAPASVRGEVLSQLEALAGACQVEGVPMRSAKAHGALYNVMATDDAIARAVAGAVAEFDPGLVLVVSGGTAMETAATDAGLAVVAEGFCERAYLPDGLLAPRSMTGSVIHDPQEAARRAVSIARTRRVAAIDGSMVALDCATLCIHGDSPTALAVAGAVRHALEAAGTAVAPFVG